MESFEKFLEGVSSVDRMVFLQIGFFGGAGKAAGEATPARKASAGEAGIWQKLGDGGGEGGGIVGRDEQTGFIMGNVFGDAVNIGSDNGQAGGHSF